MVLSMLKKWNPLLGILPAGSWGSTLNGCVSESPASGLLFAHSDKQTQKPTKGIHSSFSTSVNTNKSEGLHEEARQKANRGILVITLSRGRMPRK